ncbi:DUF3606 domain-containing protein [Ramlibacter sp. PS4R-6]|uniref:DUF3606 domain-containing protein n=1 Tax=Ramlibacter sp. PS4R-6 TaxID=3133438 RepID=UPI0030B4355B
MSEDFVADGTQEIVIALDHDWERRNWARWLGCSEDELKLAVETMGPDPDNVRRFLRQAR